MQKYWFCSQAASVVTPDDSWHVWFLFATRQTFRDTTSQEDEWDVVRFPHTGSSQINFLWPLKTLQGNKDSKAEQRERKDNLPSLWRSPASESSRCCYFCHRWADAIICRAVTCRAHAVRCTNVEPAILSQSRRHLCHGGVTTRLL